MRRLVSYKHLALLFITIFLLFTLFGERNYASINPTIQWNLVDVWTAEAWNVTQGSPEIVVAIIDSGVDISHPDLVNQCWVNIDEIPNNGKDDDNNSYIDDLIGWDFRSNDNDPSPGHSHGTFVAGLIAADDDNDLLVGVAPKIKIMPIRFLDNNNLFSGSDWGMFSQAINYAIDNGADIIQMSIQAYGVPPYSFYESIRRAYEEGVFVVSVVGNFEDHVTYPGKYAEVIAVSATKEDGTIASFSSPGDENEICAPGENVFSIKPYSTSLVMGSGTSFAAPLVSGAIALMLSINRTLPIEEAREILHNTSTDLGPAGKDINYGYGLLNVSKAVEYVASITNINITTTVNSTSAVTSTDTNTSQVPGLDLLISFVCLNIVILKKRNKKSKNSISNTNI
ncbi:MAG: S8 family serine peptidase [Candidatus Hodarchaeales archaeon]